MGPGQKGGCRVLKPLEPRPILRTELHGQMQLVTICMLFDHFAPGVQPGDARSVAGAEANMMGLGA